MHRSYFLGFTLIEFSIVLVIISLLVGGVLAGRSLIANSEVNALVQEVGRYQAAFNTFRVKYNAKPGDMANAQALWGTDPTGCPAGNTSQTLRQETCNGNGDGLASPYIVANNDYGPEKLRVWQHLANSGLIEGQYSGHRYGSYYTDTGAVGSNIPHLRALGRKSNAGWGFVNPNRVSTSISDGVVINRFFGEGLSLGNCGNGNLTICLPLFGAITTAAIDKKIDDGHPLRGRMVIDNWMVYWPTYADTSCWMNVGSRTLYRHDSDIPRCFLYFYFEAY